MVERDTAIVTGAGRGFGRGIAEYLARNRGMHVVGISRTVGELDRLADLLGKDAFTGIVGDVSLRETAQCVLAEHHPALVVLNAGAVPHMAPVHLQTFEQFERCWRTDTKQVFEWVGELLSSASVGPIRQEATVLLAMSSAAALRGSPCPGATPRPRAPSGSSAATPPQ